VRAYEGGKPVDSKANHFQWRTEGAKEGDLVFVTGNPGTTGRLKTVAQCEYMRDHAFPGRLRMVHAELEALNAKAKESPEEERKLRATILRNENTRKAVQGYLDGLLNPRIMAIKQKAEADLRAAVAKDPALQQKYGDAWDKIAAIQQEKVAAKGDAKALEAIVARENAEQKRIGEACFAVYGTSIPPDATMSLRISDGVVKGYEMNGTIAPSQTSLYGLFARHHEFGGRYPFDLPQPWLAAEKAFDLRTPFNFVSTCDIIGGNSGSPVINRKGELVGLIFDGNIQSLVGDFIYDETQNRAVSVSSAAISEALRKVYNAGALADQLGK